MADGTWTAAVDNTWSEAGNWSGASAPGDGEVATFDGSEAASGLPTSAQPAAGTIDFVFSADYSGTAIDATILGSAGAAIGDITFNNGGSARIDANFGTATVNTGGSCYLFGSGVTLTGNVVLNGGVISRASPVGGYTTLDGSVTATADSTFQWNRIYVQGIFDAAGNTITHQSGGVPLLTCDDTGELDLGGAATFLPIVIASGATTVTLGNNISCYSFTMTAGTFDGAAKTITVNGGAVLYTAGTVNNLPDITFAASGNAAWAATAPNRLGQLRVNTGVTVTLNGNLAFTGLLDGTGVGTVALGANNLSCYMGAATHWNFTGATTGSGTVQLIPTVTPLTLNNAVDVDSTDLAIGAGADRVLTIPGITCGDLTVAPVAGTNKTVTLTATGNLTCDSLTFGSAAVATRNGILTLAAGKVHTCTGAAARAGTGTGHAINLKGRLILGGTFTGTGITVTPTQEGEIDCGGFGRVTAVTATGNRLVVRRAVDGSSVPMRAWGGDGCTNVMFKGQKIIGLPGIN